MSADRHFGAHQFWVAEQHACYISSFLPARSRAYRDLARLKRVKPASSKLVSWPSIYSSYTPADREMRMPASPWPDTPVSDMLKTSEHGMPATDQPIVHSLYILSVSSDRDTGNRDTLTFLCIAVVLLVCRSRNVEHMIVFGLQCV